MFTPARSGLAETCNDLAAVDGQKRPQGALAKTPEAIRRGQQAIRDTERLIVDTRVKLSLSRDWIMTDRSAVSVVWRVDSWRCESVTVQDQRIVRLYDGTELLLETGVTAETLTAVTGTMRRSVLRYLASEDRLKPEDSNR